VKKSLEPGKDGGGGGTVCAANTVKGFGVEGHIETFVLTERTGGENVEESFPWRENRGKERREGGDHENITSGICVW